MKLLKIPVQSAYFSGCDCGVSSGAKIAVRLLLATPFQKPSVACKPSCARVIIQSI